MDALIITFFGIFGAIIGSFLNVVILRYNTGKGLTGRSGCFTCGKTLQSHELIPVLSYLFQKGRCLGCRSSISFQYPLVEGITALLFALAAFKELTPFSNLYTALDFVSIILTLGIISILVVIAVYDYRHKIIPDLFSLIFAVLALAKTLLYYQESIFHFPYILDFFAGPIVALPFVLIWFFSKGKWMGLGDGKLALGIGWFLGLSSALSAICIAFWVGAIVSLGILFSQNTMTHKRRISMKSEIPFAPFLIIGTLVAYFIPIDLFHLNTFLYFL